MLTASSMDAASVANVLARPAEIAAISASTCERASVRFYQPELDVLRFFAFFAVFFFHTALYTPEFFAQHHLPYFLGVLANSIAKAGAYGVDLFFVLSAYLIT